MSTKHDDLIGGEGVAGTGHCPNINPSNLAGTIGQYAQGDAAQFDAGVAVAAAFPA